MTRKLEVHYSVYQELEDIYLWYENNLEGLGLRFLNEWEYLTQYIEKYPEHFQKRAKQYRQAKIKHFPYLVIYVIEVDAVVIYAVVHDNKHPSKRYKKQT